MALVVITSVVDGLQASEDQQNVEPRRLWDISVVKTTIYKIDKHFENIGVVFGKSRGIFCMRIYAALFNVA